MFEKLASVFHQMVTNHSLTFGAVTGTIGVFVDAMFNAKGFNTLHVYIAAILAIVVFLDFTVGVRVAKKTGNYQSNIGIDAIIRDGLIFLIVAVGWIFDQLLGTGAFVFSVLALAFTYHNFQSFCANLYVLGWDKHFPMWAFKILESEITAKVRKYAEKGDK
jgi:phage-related holin